MIPARAATPKRISSSSVRRSVPPVGTVDRTRTQEHAPRVFPFQVLHSAGRPTRRAEDLCSPHDCGPLLPIKIGATATRYAGRLVGFNRVPAISEGNTGVLRRSQAELRLCAGRSAIIFSSFDGACLRSISANTSSMPGSADTQHVTTLFDAIMREREAFLSGARPNKSNWFKKIDGPPGRGIFHTGDDGWDALWALTDSCMRIGKITQRADRQAVMHTLSRVLMRKFAEEGLEVNDRNVARALAESVKAAKRTFKTETHFIPCHLSTDAGKVGLSLGAVRFVSRAEAKRALGKALKAERDAKPPHRKRDRPHMLQAINHYKGFRWFAQVTVADCADKRSESVALAAATSALDFVQLLIGARHSRRMGISGQPSLYERRASIALDNSTGRLSISTGWSSLGEISLPADWTEQILGGEGQDGLDRAGVLLESRLNPDLDRPLSQRLLDAAQWFGEAVRDASPSTRVVKYVTAIERLTLTEKAGDITESVSNRVAALTTGLIEGRSFEENKSAFKKVYGLRSDLVHGSISPNDAKVALLIGDACDYAENAIRRALYNFPTRLLREEEANATVLNQFFDGLVDWMKAEREEAQRLNCA